MHIYLIERDFIGKGKGKTAILYLNTEQLCQ